MAKKIQDLKADTVLKKLLELNTMSYYGENL